MVVCGGRGGMMMVVHGGGGRGGELWLNVPEQNTWFVRSDLYKRDGKRVSERKSEGA